MMKSANITPRRSITALLVLILILSWVLTACSPGGGSGTPGTATTAPTTADTPGPTESPTASPSPTPEPDGTTGTITLWHSWDEGQVPVLVEIIRLFQDENPRVHFDVLYIPIDDLPARFEESARESGVPTLILGPGAWGPPLADAGLLKDLSGLPSPELVTTVNQAALGSVQYRGGLIGFPYAVNGVVLYRNRSIIPEPPETFDDLVRLATSATQGERVGAMLERSFFFSGGHLSATGGQVMNEDGTPAFNTPEGAAWLELLSAFELAGPTDFLSDQDLELFKEGNLGFLIEGSWRQEELLEALSSDRLAVDPWPLYGRGQLAGFVRSENIYMNARADDESAAAGWRFIEHFLSPGVQELLTEAGRIPALTSVETSDPLMNQMVAALAGGATYPPYPAMDLYISPMDFALRSYFQEGAAAEDALQAAEERILEALAEQMPSEDEG